MSYNNEIAIESGIGNSFKLLSIDAGYHCEERKNDRNTFEIVVDNTRGYRFYFILNNLEDVKVRVCGPKSSSIRNFNSPPVYFNTDLYSYSSLDAACFSFALKLLELKNNKGVLAKGA